MDTQELSRHIDALDLDPKRKNAILGVIELKTGSDMQQILDSMHAMFDGMNTKFDAKFDSMEARFDAKFDSMEAKFDAKFHKVESRLDSMNAKFDAKFDKVESRLDSMEDKFGAFKSDVESKFNFLKWLIYFLIVLVAILKIMSY